MMKTRLLLGSLATIALASTAMAQDAPADSAVEPPEFTPANVTPDNPFGDIDVGNAGETAADAYAFAADLNGAQVIEILRRCQVIHPLAISTQMLVDIDTFQDPDEAMAGDDAAGDVAGDDEPPPMPGGDLGVAADIYYDMEDVSLCANLQGVILGVDITDPMDAEAD